jgi:hypothetical protein
MLNKVLHKIESIAFYIAYRIRSFNTRRSIKRTPKAVWNAGKESRFRQAIKQIKIMQAKDKIAGVGSG